MLNIINLFRLDLMMEKRNCIPGEISELYFNVSLFVRNYAKVAVHRNV